MPSFPHVAATTSTLSTRVFFDRLIERMRAHSGPLHKLHIGDTWLEPYAPAMAEAQSGARLHTYSPVHGEPVLLDAIASHLKRRGGVQRTTAEIQVTAGATSALSVACQTLLDPDDEVLLPAPFWPLIRGIIASRGAVPVQVPLFDRLRTDGFDLRAALTAAITPRTRALYLNSPHNPTGVILSESEAAIFADVAREHDLWVLCDEVYEELWLGDTPHAPLWARDDLRERTIAVHSMSKGFGLAGARVGWMHGPADAIAAMRAVQTFQVYCANKPLQHAAARALDDGHQWIADAREHYREAAKVAANALGLAVPAGGTFLFFDVAEWVAGREAAANDAMPFLFECLDRGVLLTPGGASGADYATWVRLCFTTVPLPALTEAVTAVADVLHTKERA